jgi:glycerophosphoryl diester phosphodiesterase
VRALDEGADGVELDVRLTTDGEVVCLHDPTLLRPTGGRDARHVAEVAYPALPRLASGERVATLAEALAVCRRRVVNVEVKSDDAPGFLALTRAVARQIAQDGGGARVIVSSFDPRVVLAMAAIAPGVARGMLVGDRTAPLATALPLALRPVIEAAHVHEALLTEARIARLMRAGLRVAAWTVNDAPRARELARAGVATLISDRPGAMREAVVPR